MAFAVVMAGDAQQAMRALPVVSLAALLEGRSPLVLAPHADDESLGCGGLLAGAAAAGLRPAVLVLTDGTGSHPGSRRYPAERLLALRESEAREAVAILGVAAERIGFLRTRDTAAPTEGAGFDEAVAAIVAALDAWGCGVLLAPWRHDPHCDHLAAHLMARAAALRVGVTHLAYPVWGWTLPAGTVLDGPEPAGVRVEIAAHVAAKRRAIAAHRSQYAGLIDDDPQGFQMKPDFLDNFTGDFETFLTAP